jgi:nucleoside-diphosphate-sugar epimerase
MRIAVLGSTGVAGRAFVTHARASGYDLSVRRADLLDDSALEVAVRGCEVAVNLATSIPKSGGRGNWSLNDRIRTEGTAHLLSACAKEGVKVLVQQSVAMLHCAADDRAQTEDDPIIASGVLASAGQMETLCRSATMDVRLVRGGLFYGPGTGSIERWLDDAARPDFRVPGDGGAWLSPVHVEDYARALLTVAEVGSPSGTYIACDDEPVRWDALYAHMAALVGRTRPETGGLMALRSFRVSNERLRHLGWRPSNALLSTSPSCCEEPK